MTTPRNTPSSRRCPTCHGAGAVTVNTTNPYGYGPDPQCDVDVVCRELGCYRGWIRTAPEDPIAALRYWRARWRRSPYAAMRYGALLQRVVSPASVRIPGAPGAELPQ